MAPPETSSIGARLHARLGQVEITVRELGHELESALEALKQRGTVPTLDRLEPAREAVSSLWAETATVARDLGFDPAPFHECPCLAVLSQTIAMIQTREREQTHRQARKMLALEKVARLVHFRARTDQARAVLLELQQRGHELSARLHSQEEATTVEEVLSGRHALVAFIELVEELQRSMEGERLDELEERVQSALGRLASRAAHHVVSADELLPAPKGWQNGPREELPAPPNSPIPRPSGDDLGEETVSVLLEADGPAAEARAAEPNHSRGTVSFAGACEMPEAPAERLDGKDGSQLATVEAQPATEKPRPALVPLPARPTPRPIRRPLTDRPPLSAEIPLLVPEPDAPALPTDREDLEHLLWNHVSKGELVEAAAFAHVLRVRVESDAGPAPAVVLALIGYVSGLPGMAREDWETWVLHEVDARTLPFALLWGVSAVLWHGAAVTQLDPIKDRVRTAFGGVDSVTELLVLVLDLGARGSGPGEQILASRSASQSGHTYDELRRRLDNAFARASSSPYQNKDCKRAWKALTQERIEPLRRAVLSRSKPAEIRRLAEDLDVVDDLRRYEIEGKYRSGMLTRFREIQELVQQLAETEEGSRAASKVERLSDLIVAACGHARWGALLRRVLEPRTLRRESAGGITEVPREALGTIHDLERRRALFPVFCDEQIQTLGLTLLASGLMGKPLDATNDAELFREYIELQEFGAAARVLDQVSASESDRQQLVEIVSQARFATESRAEELLRQCRESWAEAASAAVVGPEDEVGGSPFERAERWFRDHPSRLRPLVHWLEQLRSALVQRIEAEREVLERRLADTLTRARTVVSRDDGLELLLVREEAVRAALQERDWSIAQQGIDDLEAVTGDSAALRLPGREATGIGHGWQRAIPARPARLDLTAVELPAEAPDQGEEGAKFLGTWNELSASREKPGLTWKVLGGQWARWMGFEPVSDRPPTPEGVVFEFALRSGVSWVSDRFGARGTRYQLLVPKAKRGLTGAIRRTLQQLTAQAQDDLLRVVLYPGVLPAHSLPSTSSSERTVVIDDQDLIRLLECSADERPRGFLEAVLPQLPIELAAPYRVNGATPESMFVGRANELELLMGSDAPTVIFSGRCLGKTSLLRQAERRFHDPSRGRFAFFRSISTLGDLEVSGSQLPNLGLLEELAGALRNAGFAFQGAGTLEAFIRSMRALLHQHPKHEFLFLLDEADGFADSERRFGGKGVSWALRDLQFESGDRLRFTFAGYQHVHRVCRERSLAFANWRGLGKLSVLSEEDALRLVRQPMEEIGFTFATQSLAGRIVHYAGHHPRLLQVFCDRLSRHVRQRTRTEPFRVTGSDVEQVFNDTSANGFVEALRYTLNLNLQEDGRLQFIVYWLVEQAMRGALSLERFSLHGIHEALVEEAGDSTQLDETGTRLLLDELEALGVIHTDGGHYRLANRQHARLLFHAADFRAVRDRAAQRLKERPIRRRIYCAPDEVTEVVAQAQGSHVCVLGVAGSGDEVLFDALFSTRANGVFRIECESAADWGDLERRVSTRCELGGNGALAERLLTWQARCGVPTSVVLEDVDALARSHPQQFGKLLERLSAARLDGGDLRVRLVLSGGVELARLFNEELLLYSTTHVTLSRLETGDVESWCRARRLVVAADLRARLHEVAGGRLPVLEDFRGALVSRLSSQPDEVPVSRADVDEYAAALREGRRVALRRQLLGGLSGSELRTLEFLYLEWGDLAGDQVEGFAELLAGECQEVAKKDVSTILATLASLDLLGGSSAAGARGYALIPGDPLRQLLEASRA